MFVLFVIFYIVLAYFSHESYGQLPLPYTLGYRSSFKSYQQGNVNLILSAPHGGSLMPSDVPDRTLGGCLRLTGPNAGVCTWWFNDTCIDGQRCNTTTVKDTLSDEFAENVANELSKQYGLLNHLLLLVNGVVRKLILIEKLMKQHLMILKL